MPPTSSVRGSGDEPRRPKPSPVWRSDVLSLTCVSLLSQGNVNMLEKTVCISQDCGSYNPGQFVVVFLIELRIRAHKHIEQLHSMFGENRCRTMYSRSFETSHDFELIRRECVVGLQDA